MGQFMMKVLLVTLISFNSYSADIANGKFLFEDWGCKGCHGIGSQYSQDSSKGPNLTGLYSRRQSDWVKRFTKNPQAMIDSGDKDAVELYKKYGVVMKTFKLNDSEWNDVLEFLKKETK